MKFITMVKTLNPDVAVYPPPQLMEAITKLGMEAGLSMMATGGMALAATITTQKGQMITDGPYAEAKEMVGGYAIYELDTYEEIVKWSQRFVALHHTHWPEWDGEVTILQLQQFNMAA